MGSKRMWKGMEGKEDDKKGNGGRIGNEGEVEVEDE